MSNTPTPERNPLVLLIEEKVRIRAEGNPDALGAAAVALTADDSMNSWEPAYAQRGTNEAIRELLRAAKKRSPEERRQAGEALKDLEDGMGRTAWRSKWLGLSFIEALETPAEVPEREKEFGLRSRDATGFDPYNVRRGPGRPRKTNAELKSKRKKK
jgi:hypothetical protein